ncbi:MAG: hypothetical protein ACFFDS_09595 [Candidatus Thorarchaeota archaeon]
MDCRFCKLENISLLDDGVTYKCQYCGYAFEVSRAGILYDKMMQMPLASWLLASIIWFSAMLTGVIFGLGFNSSSLSTTIIFLIIYGGCAFLYGLAISFDFMSVIWIWIKGKITRKSQSFEEAKSKIQEERKKKIVSEMATGQVIDEVTGRNIDTDIRPGEKRVPKIAPSFKAGLYTVILALFFLLIFNFVFPPLV